MAAIPSCHHLAIGAENPSASAWSSFLGDAFSAPADRHATADFSTFHLASGDQGLPVADGNLRQLEHLLDQLGPGFVEPSAFARRMILELSSWLIMLINSVLGKFFRYQSRKVFLCFLLTLANGAHDLDAESESEREREVKEPKLAARRRDQHKASQLSNTGRQ